MAFIVFEGIDACGKSTQIKKLASALAQKNISHVLTREPGGTPLAEEIRKILLKTEGETPRPRTELLLYEAGRAQHVEEVIRPALNNQKWVISDRFAASTLAFQAAGRNLEPSEIGWLNNYATGGLWPDLTILIDIPVTESRRRLSQRNALTGDDRFELEKSDFHEKVRQSYLSQVKAQPTGWHVVDGLKSVDEIHREILNKLVEKKWIKN